MGIVGIVGIVGVEKEDNEKEDNEKEDNEKEDNKNVEEIDNSLIHIYEKFQIIQNNNNKKYDKFNFNKNITQEPNTTNYTGSKPIPIPKPYK